LTGGIRHSHGDEPSLGTIGEPNRQASHGIGIVVAVAASTTELNPHVAKNLRNNLHRGQALNVLGVTSTDMPEKTDESRGGELEAPRALDTRGTNVSMSLVSRLFDTGDGSNDTRGNTVVLTEDNTMANLPPDSDEQVRTYRRRLKPSVGAASAAIAGAVVSWESQTLGWSVVAPWCVFVPTAANRARVGSDSFRFRVLEDALVLAACAFGAACTTGACSWDVCTASVVSG